VIESQFCVLPLPVKQNIIKHHKRFTDKTLNHITYIDKELWGPPDDTLKQKILNDAKKNNNKVIVVYDAATGEKNIIHEPSGSQSLEFETVEVISRWYQGVFQTMHWRRLW
jgi:hypothetical protein